MFWKPFVGILFCAMTLLLPAPGLGETSSATSQPFFAFDNGVGRDQKWPIEKQVQTLKALGYHGIGYSGVQDLAQRLAAFKTHGLTLFSLYVPCFPANAETPYDPQFAQVFKQLAGTKTMLLLTVQGKSTDEQAARTVQAIADLAAAHQVKICLYPHYGFHVATARDALRVTKLVDRSNVGLTINLCHELRSGNGNALDQIIKEAGPKIFMASINGAEKEGKDWGELIMPLGQGDFDMLHFLGQLKKVGFTGPIGLQCYNVKGDQRDNLAHAMGAWHVYHNSKESQQ